jgi:predicted acylesterase/phospholipase RssA
MAKKQVALVLSGGSSLGSYIAGALDELTRAFAASDQYEIDIITGASAGATTSAIISHGLLYRGGHTALHDVWVENIDIVDMLAPDLPAGEWPTVLNGRPLREQAERTLAWPDPSKAGERAPFCAESLVVGMTLSNTHPLPYISRLRQPAAGRDEIFVEYRTAEQESFYVGAGLAPTDPIWLRMGQVARASAAIPFVFPMVRLARRAGEDFDDSQYIQKPNFTGEAQFWYTDGGMLNNLPVDLAWYHARKRDADPANRVVVVVNPWRPGTSAPSLTPPHPGLLPHALGLLSAVMGESSALQFDHEVILRSLQAQPGGAPADSGGLRALPGVDRAPVSLLSNFALIMPRAGDPPCHGAHMHALAAFLDRRFREYDFRRGAADAQLAAREILGITYDGARPDGFYTPEQDPTLVADLSSYEALDHIPSSRDPRRSVRQVFEAALDTRLDALARTLNPPGPDALVDPLLATLLKRYVRGQLPAAWGA